MLLLNLRPRFYIYIYFFFPIKPLLESLVGWTNKENKCERTRIRVAIARCERELLRKYNRSVCVFCCCYYVYVCVRRKWFAFGHHHHHHTLLLFWIASFAFGLRWATPLTKLYVFKYRVALWLYLILSLCYYPIQRTPWIFITHIEFI